MKPYDPNLPSAWRLEQEALENAYARRLLIEYGIREVTTQRQAKNGTREFEFPVSKRGKFFLVPPVTEQWNRKDRLRLACFKTGYVRNQNSCSSAYQLNPQYKRTKKWVFLTNEGLKTKTYITISRAKIYSGIARLNYMLEFYKRNYLNK